MYCVIIFIFCVLPPVRNQWAIDDSGCITPNSAVGNCIPIKECLPILEVMTQTDPLPPEVVQEISLYQCGFTQKSVKVCCPYDSSTLKYLIIKELLTSTVFNHNNLNLLPQDCGLPYESNKIIQGDVTRVFQFPWMALLSYKTKNGIDFKCGGAIINEWYILTAAHCISNLGQLQLLGVRSGEHNITSPIDCNMIYKGQLECAERVQDVLIGETIPHPDYNPYTFRDDIGLIRLAWPLNTSVDSVKPICLPTTEKVTNLNLTKEKLTVTGWGFTEKGKKSEVLLKVDVPVLSNEECRNIYKNIRNISDNQLCAGGTKQDSCEGDSGGPLQGLYFHNDDVRYVQQGIVSYGSILCGQKGIPGVYTRIDKYMQWILDNIY